MTLNRRNTHENTENRGKQRIMRTEIVKIKRKNTYDHVVSGAAIHKYPYLNRLQQWPIPRHYGDQLRLRVRDW